jgi:hypothetical protein
VKSKLNQTKAYDELSTLILDSILNQYSIKNGINFTHLRFNGARELVCRVRNIQCTVDILSTFPLKTKFRRVGKSKTG